MGEIRKLNLLGEGVPDSRERALRRGDLEELARYIANKVPASEFILKGGLILSTWAKVERYTSDIDLSIFERSLYDQLKAIFAQYGELLKKQGLIYSYEIVEDVQEDCSGGVKYRRENGTVFLSVDVAWADGTYDYVLIDSGSLGTVQLSTVYQIMSDKLTVLFSRKRFRRVKDLYDLYLLAKNCDVDVSRLREVMSAQDRYPLDLEHFPFTQERLEGLLHAYNKFQVSDKDGVTRLTKPEFGELVDEVSSFILKLLKEGD